MHFTLFWPTRAVAVIATVAMVCRLLLGALPAAAVDEPLEIFGCPGDCDADGRVAIAEIRYATTRALDPANRRLQSCVAAEQTCDGEVTIDDLVAAVRARALGCTPGMSSLIERATGAYDASGTQMETNPAASASFTAPAVLQREAAGIMSVTIALGTLSGAVLSGALAPSGIACVEGVLIEADVASDARGKLTLLEDAQGYQLSGHFEVPRPRPGEKRVVDLAASRARQVNAAIEGDYRIRMVHRVGMPVVERVTTMVLPVRSVDERGLGLCGPADEMDAMGRHYAIFGQAPCWITPQGRISLFAEYDAEGANDCDGALTLSGQLPIGMPTGGGDFFVGFLPATCLDVGLWTATVVSRLGGQDAAPSSIESMQQRGNCESKTTAVG